MSIDEEILGSMGADSGAWAKSGSRSGPWPVEGVSRHVFLGFTVDSADFFVEKGMELEGKSIQARFYSIDGHNKACEWGDQVIVVPQDIDAFVARKDVPEKRKKAIFAQIGRIKPFILKALEQDPGSLKAGVNAVNKMIASGERFGFMLNHKIEKYKTDQGAEGERHDIALIGTFDATNIDVPSSTELATASY